MSQTHPRDVRMRAIMLMRMNDYFSGKGRASKRGSLFLDDMSEVVKEVVESPEVGAKLKLLAFGMFVRSVSDLLDVDIPEEIKECRRVISDLQALRQMSMQN